MHPRKVRVVVVRCVLGSRNDDEGRLTTRVSLQLSGHIRGLKYNTLGHGTQKHDRRGSSVTQFSSNIPRIILGRLSDVLTILYHIGGISDALAALAVCI